MANTLLPNLVNDKTLVWVLTLLNMEDIPIAVIQYESLNFTRKFDDYDELSFTVPRYLYERKGKSTIDNKTWFAIKAGLHIQLDVFEQIGINWTTVFQERFAVQQPTLSESRGSNSQQWSCIALHQLIFNKIKLRGYDSTRKLIEPDEKPNPNRSTGDCTARHAGKSGYIGEVYRPNIHLPNDTVAETGVTFNLKDNTKGGVLDYILEYQLPDWSVAYYDEALLDVSQQGKIDENVASATFDSVYISWFTDIYSLHYDDVTIQHYNEYLDLICDGDNSYIEKVIAGLRGTKEDELMLRAAIHDLELQWGAFRTLMDTDIHGTPVQWDTDKEEIRDEPLKGAQMIANAEQAIMAFQELTRLMCSYQYVEGSVNEVIGQYALYGNQSDPDDSDTRACLLVFIKDLCRAILEYFITPFAFYKSAVGSVPYRTLKLDTNLVDVFKQLEDNYLCVFSFDNINKTISIYSRKNQDINKTQSLIISPDNLMTDISYQAITDQVVTKLYATGKDDLKLSGYSLNGMNYVEDYGYYIENGFIEQDLAERINEYMTINHDGLIYQQYHDEYQGNPINTQEKREKILKELRNETIKAAIEYIDSGSASASEITAIYNTLSSWFTATFEVLSGSTYLAQSVTPGIGDDKRTYYNKTLKQMQELYASVSNSLSVCQSLARQYEIVHASQEPTNKEKTCDDSWWKNITSRTAITNATDSTLLQIEKEINPYLYKDIRQYVDVYGGDYVLTAMGEIWMLDVINNPDIPNTNFYMYKNIESYIPDAIKTFQEQFLPKNIVRIQFENGVLSRTQDKVFPHNGDELKPYIYEEDISWSSITSASALSLYAIEYLEYLRKIPITLNLGVIDILSNYRYQFDWSKITDVGAYLYVDFQDYNLNYDLFKLLSFTYSLSPTDRNLQLTLSNTYDLQNDLNQVIVDVWAYSYKQLQDISEYKESWESFIAKEDTLIQQGQQIRADVNAIVDDAGKVVVGGKGLTTSKTPYNALRKNADGYYVRDKTISTTKPGANVVKKIPDHIVFEGADMTYTTSDGSAGSFAPAGETVLTISGMGGGSASNSGLPRYYSAPFFSDRLEVLDGRKSWDSDFNVENGEKVAYYQELRDGVLTWYRAVLNHSDEIETDEHGNPQYYDEDAEQPSQPKYLPADKVQATDFNGVNHNAQNLWWLEDIPSGSADNRKIMGYVPLEGKNTDDYKVWIYPATTQIILQVYRKEGTHLPMLQWGLGTGSGDEGRGFVEKVANGLDIYYITRNQTPELQPDGSYSGDSTSRARGVAIRDSGVYQIRNGSKTSLRPLALIPIFHVGSTIAECVTTATASGLNIEKGDLFITSSS